MENKKIVLNEENGLEISTNISPRDFDKISIIYRQYLSNQIGDMVMTLESVKVLLVNKEKTQYIDDMLDGKEGVLDAYEVLEDWTEKILDIILKLKDRKKKSKQ